MSLYHQFKEKIRINLMKSMNKTNIHTVPYIIKIIVAIGIGSLATRKGIKDFSDLEKNISQITGQKPQLIKSKKSISNFKLRENMPVMLRVTLRKQKAYDFIERLVNLTLPRVRDFKGINIKNFDDHGNLNIGLNNQIVFAELKPEDIQTTCGIQVTIVTSTNSNEEAIQLLESLGMTFLRN